MRVALSLITGALSLTFVDPLAYTDELSLDAAKTSAANGGMPALVSYAEHLRFGWVWGLLMVEANQLVDARNYSPGDDEREPLMRHIRCIQNLGAPDIATKALAMNPSRADLTSKVETFSSAVALTIGDLCRTPSLTINSKQSRDAWVLVVAPLVQGAAGSHVELTAQATTNGNAFPTLNSCQVSLLEWEHKMAAIGATKNSYALSCIKVFK